MKLVRKLLDSMSGSKLQAKPADALAPADGMYVSALGALLLQGDSAQLSLSSGASHSVRMLSQGSGIAVTTVCTATPAGEPLSCVSEFPLVQADRAQQLFSATVAAWHATLMHGTLSVPTGAASRGTGLSPRAGFIWGVLSGAAVIVALSLVIAPPGSAALAGASHGTVGAAIPLRAPAPGIAVAGAQPAASGLAGAGTAATGAAGAGPAAGPSAAEVAALAEAAQRRLQQARLGAQELARVSANAHRIEIRQGTAPLVAFSDPNCPACQDLERESAAMTSGTGFSVIPVAFQSGSRVVVARVFCAPNPAQAWAEAIKGIVPRNQPCERGLQMAEQNNALFAEIGASATPTLVAANGQMAQGSAKSKQLEVFAATYAQ